MKVKSDCCFCACFHFFSFLSALSFAGVERASVLRCGKHCSSFLRIHSFFLSFTFIPSFLPLLSILLGSLLACSLFLVCLFRSPLIPPCMAHLAALLSRRTVLSSTTRSATHSPASWRLGSTLQPTIVRSYSRKYVLLSCYEKHASVALWPLFCRANIYLLPLEHLPKHRSRPLIWNGTSGD